MDELLTWENVLRYVLYLAAMLALYTVGVTIGATIKWFREHVFATPAVDDTSEATEPPIPTSAH